MTSQNVSPRLRNWAGNLSYTARVVAEPADAAGVAAIIVQARAAGERVRALGSRHSFNDVADTDGVLLSTRALAGDPVLDIDAQTVTVGAGTRYGELAVWLEERGFGLANLASLPHISIAGAIATGTHGSGDAVGSLASAVRGLELVDGTGTVRSLGADHPDLPGAVVAVGALGIVTRVTLSVVPSFAVAQSVFSGPTWEQVGADLAAVTAAGYSVSMFTGWRGDGPDQIWVKHRVGDADGTAALRALGVTAATVKAHPLPGIDPVSCTEQLGVAGAWYERLPHFKLAFTPSNGDELQTEYLVPREHAVAAIAALRALSDRIAPLLQICEIRTMAADDLWLSPASGTDAVGLHFTWVQRQAEVEALLPAIEAALAPLCARPHWGKLFTHTATELAALYPQLDAFRELVVRYDPDGIFRNAFTERTLGP